MGGYFYDKGVLFPLALQSMIIHIVKQINCSINEANMELNLSLQNDFFLFFNLSRAEHSIDN